MSTPSGQGRGLGDELTNFLMIALVAVFGVAVVLRAAGSIAAFLAGSAQPQSGITGGVGVLLKRALTPDRGHGVISVMPLP